MLLGGSRLEPTAALAAPERRTESRQVVPHTRHHVRSHHSDRPWEREKARFEELSFLPHSVLCVEDHRGARD